MLGVTDTLSHTALSALPGSGSRIGGSVLVILSAWFLSEQPFRARLDEKINLSD